MKLISKANWTMIFFLIFPFLFQQSASKADDLSDLAILESGSDQFTELRPRMRVDDYFFYDEERHLISLREFRGSHVILNFWATWCVPCIKEMPSLAKLASDYADQNVQVVGVSLDHTEVGHIRNFLDHNSAGNLEIYFDPETSNESIVTRKNGLGLKIYGLPITYFLDSNGYALGYIIGRVEWQSTQAKFFLDSFTSK
ncbi:TlpA disulfide reductase family protein [Thalassospira xiamenensis]|uniref:AhpC/TSA family protein n=1 Tax=Thalassospira xiamenensis TaxID=220697 RepID=A0A285TYB8_9PROT|nr:TlpA disulfide reductase family protein [Thalassospira xiamenensis]SOC31038.1 AhpC/TSA family protein [Thalassospira xiamenensis]